MLRRTLPAVIIGWLCSIALIGGAVLGGYTLPSQTVAYTRLEEDRTTQIALMDTRTGLTIDLREIAPVLVASESSSRTPLWSPDGSRLAFVGISSQRTLDVYEFDIAQRQTTSVTAQYGYETLPIYAPDSQRQVFNPSFGRTSPIFLVDPAATADEPERLVTRVRGRPVWLDNDTLLFLRETFDENDDEEIAESQTSNLRTIDIYQLNLQTGERVNLTENMDDYGLPQLSPDASQIAFASNGRITIMDLATRETRMIPNDTPILVDTYPRWSPDGRYISFSSQRSGNREIHVMDTQTDRLWNVSQHNAYDIGHQWLDNDDLIFVSARAGQQDLYRANIHTGKITRLTYTDGHEEDPITRPLLR